MIKINREQYHYEREMNRNTTNNIEEFKDYQNYCIREMKSMIETIESDGVRKIKNSLDYRYGFAGGLKYAIQLLLGQIND